jgi:6-phosphogluconate dehydrogenase
MMRNLSGSKSDREKAAEVLHGPEQRFQGDRAEFIEQLKNALYASIITTYAQGLALLAKASEAYEYGLDLETVARIWRGGCIIRAALLEDIRSAFNRQHDLSNLLLGARLGEDLLRRQHHLRMVVKTGVELGLPVPAFMASLGYFDAYRSARLPANLVQAQRDYFGSHTYERIDMGGTFHTPWEQ